MKIAQSIITASRIVYDRNNQAILGILLEIGTLEVIITKNITSVSKIVARKLTLSPVPYGKK